MIIINGCIIIHHEGKEITFDDLEYKNLHCGVEHSTFYECRGEDKDGIQYSGVLEKCCGEYECISDIETV